MSSYDNMTVTSSPREVIGSGWSRLENRKLMGLCDRKFLRGWTITAIDQLPRWSLLHTQNSVAELALWVRTFDVLVTSPYFRHLFVLNHLINLTGDSAAPIVFLSFFSSSQAKATCYVSESENLLAKAGHPPIQAFGVCSAATTSARSLFMSPSLQ